MSEERPTIRERLSAGKDVYVRNVAHRAMRTAPGELALNLYEPGSDRPDLVIIPKNSVINLSERASEQAIKNSHDLMRWTMIGLIEVLNDDEIKALTPEDFKYAQAELAKLGHGTGIGAKEQMTETADLSIDALASKDESAAPNVDLVEILSQLDQSKISEETALSRIKKIRDQLKPVDIEYATVTTVDRPDLSTWLAGIASEMAHASAVD